MRANWLIIPTCVLGLAFAAQLQAQQATDAGSRQQQLQREAQERAQEAQRMAQQTQEKAQEARTQSGNQGQAQERAQEARQMAEQTKEKAQEAKSLSGQAQQAEQQQRQQQQAQQPESRLNPAGLFRTGDIVGKDVRSRDGQSIGRIDDLTIDSKNGKIAYAVISANGGNKLVAVPWHSLQVHTSPGNRPNENFLVLNAPTQDFQKAPSFSQNNWPTSQDQIWQVGTQREEMDTNVEHQRQQQQQHEQQMREQQQRQQHEQQMREQQQHEQQMREQQQREQQQKQEQQKQEQQKQEQQKQQQQQQQQQKH